MIMFAKITKNKIHLKALVYTLELLALGLAIYLVFLPFYPLLKYGVEDQSPPAQTQNLEVAVKEAKDFKNTLPASEYDVSPNRLIISKIGVNAPIVESKNADYGLSRGAWRVPETSTPDKGGNTVITGHRFKYLPPNNLTFYLLDKMEPQDIITVLWQDKEYF
jgi:sortase (surface protein transpeptidase)